MRLVEFWIGKLDCKKSLLVKLLRVTGVKRQVTGIPSEPPIFDREPFWLFHHAAGVTSSKNKEYRIGLFLPEFLIA